MPSTVSLEKSLVLKSLHDRWKSMMSDDILMERIDDVHKQVERFWHIIECVYTKLPYHNSFHIYKCLEILDEFSKHTGFKQSNLYGYRVAEFSLFFHDFCYSPECLTNEEKAVSIVYLIFRSFCKKYSSAWWKKKGKNGMCPDADITVCILSTKHDLEWENSDIFSDYNGNVQCLVCDIDLIPLSYTMEKYLQNTLLLRKEMSHLTHDEFMEHYKKFVDKMLKRKHIYTLGYFRESNNGFLESQARKNLSLIIDVDYFLKHHSKEIAHGPYQHFEFMEANI